jgi:hypothetical protein
MARATRVRAGQVATSEMSWNQPECCYDSS